MGGFSHSQRTNFEANDKGRLRQNIRLAMAVMLWQLLLFVLEIRFGAEIARLLRETGL